MADILFHIYNHRLVGLGKILAKIPEILDFHNSLLFEDTSEYCFFRRPGIFGQGYPSFDDDPLLGLEVYASLDIEDLV